MSSLQDVIAQAMGIYKQDQRGREYCRSCSVYRDNDHDSDCDRWEDAGRIAKAVEQFYSEDV